MSKKTILDELALRTLIALDGSDLERSLEIDKITKEAKQHGYAPNEVLQHININRKELDKEVTAIKDKKF